MDKINLIDRNFAHSKLGYCSDYQTSKLFHWDRDGSSGNHFVYTDMMLKINERKVGKSIYAWLIEPFEIAPQNYKLIQQINNKYIKVFTHEKTLLDLGQNYEFVPFGCCWIEEFHQKLYFKTKNISIIASNKKQTTGHKLRHDIINKYINKIDVYGKGWNFIKHKIEGLKDYRFSIVIENCKRDYWFTEKLIDCLVTGTVPIYWGCPSIGDFFDVRGFIIIDNLEEVDKAICEISEEKYNKMLPYVKYNFEIAKSFLLPDDWVYKKIKL